MTSKFCALLSGILLTLSGQSLHAHDGIQNLLHDAGKHAPAVLFATSYAMHLTKTKDNKVPKILSQAERTLAVAIVSLNVLPRAYKLGFGNGGVTHFLSGLASVIGTAFLGSAAADLTRAAIAPNGLL